MNWLNFILAALLSSFFDDSFNSEDLGLNIRFQRSLIQLKKVNFLGIAQKVCAQVGKLTWCSP